MCLSTCFYVYIVTYTSRKKLTCSLPKESTHMYIDVNVSTYVDVHRHVSLHLFSMSPHVYCHVHL